MLVQSRQRSTSRGAVTYTAVLEGDNWVKVSELPNTKYFGRKAGWHYFEAEVPEGTVSAEFYRSNSGKETVVSSNGQEWRSFIAAHRAVSNI